MKCDRCGEQIPAEEEMDHYGRTLCEECYMHLLSPSQACDPWAVRSAQTLSQMDRRYSTLTEAQKLILQILEETGGVEPKELAQRLQATMSELEREIATLRHMEKVRGEMREGKKVVCLWD